jgi:hypothetical protein
MDFPVPPAAAEHIDQVLAANVAGNFTPRATLRHGRGSHHPALRRPAEGTAVKTPTAHEWQVLRHNDSRAVDGVILNGRQRLVRPSPKERQSPSAVIQFRRRCAENRLHRHESLIATTPASGLGPPDCGHLPITKHISKYVTVPRSNDPSVVTRKDC